MNLPAMDRPAMAIGVDRILYAHHVVAIVNANSASIKRIISLARVGNWSIDDTQGGEPRSVIITHLDRDRSPQPNPQLPSSSVFKEDPIVLCCSQPETVAHRLSVERNGFTKTSYSARTSVPMDIQLINIGFGNIVCANRVLAIVSPESAPIKRIVSEARDRNRLIDATYGRRTRAVIIMDSSHVILCSIQPETVANRFVHTKED